jgi:hypothetical protein
MGKKFNTNTAAMRAIHFRYLLDSIDSCEAESLPDDSAKARYIFDRFTKEYDYPDNRRRYASTQAMLADWLSGLPLGIECYNGPIIALCESWYGPLSDKQADKLLEVWWNFWGFKLVQMWRHFGISEA